MGKITDYPKITSLATNNVFLVDGTSGTKGIYANKLADELVGLMTSNKVLSNISIPDLGDLGTADSSTYFIVQKGTTKYRIPANEAIYKIADSVGSRSLRRRLYRGKALGSSVTSTQFAAIKNGTFVDLFPGDYWSIGNRIWRIMDYNYWPDVTENHLVIMPDSNVIENTKMNDLATNTGGYTSSKLRTETISSALTIVQGAFGDSHLLSHRTLIVTIPNGTSPQGTYGYINNTKIEIPDQIMLFGSVLVGNGPNRTCQEALGQFATCAIAPLISYRTSCWLKECIWETGFAAISSSGQYIEHVSANSATRGIRPVFGLIG